MPNEIPIPIDLPADPADAYRRGMSDAHAMTGAAGGRKRNRALTSARRSEIARKAAEKRWSKSRKNKVLGK